VGEQRLEVQGSIVYLHDLNYPRSVWHVIGQVYEKWGQVAKSFRMRKIERCPFDVTKTSDDILSRFDDCDIQTGIQNNIIALCCSVSR